MKYLRRESLKKHTSFKIGGAADYLCVPRNIEEIREALLFAKKQKLPVAVIGAGTNLLVLDRGFRGLVIKLATGLNWIRFEEHPTGKECRRVYVGSGVLLPRLIKVLAQKGLGNLEFLSGVPGSVGGAIIMNAGAWGKEIGRYVEEVRVLDKEGKERILKKKELGFAYRRSKLQKSKAIVTEITLRFKKKKKKLIKNLMQEYLLRRKKTQPLGIPNCGSVFKNPRGRFTGRLIEEAGCKGMRIGDAQVSVKHSNFIVNLGEAKAKDVLKLMTAIQKAIKNNFKIQLEPEIKIMVEFST